MQENPVLVLFDLRGHFEEREDHGRGLGRGQGRVRERVGAERMMQDIGPARQEEPRGVGEEGCGRRAIAVEIILDRLCGLTGFHGFSSAFGEVIIIVGRYMYQGSIAGISSGLRQRRS